MCEFNDAEDDDDDCIVLDDNQNMTATSKLNNNSTQHKSSAPSTSAAKPSPTFHKLNLASYDRLARSQSSEQNLVENHKTSMSTITPESITNKTGTIFNYLHNKSEIIERKIPEAKLDEQTTSSTANFDTISIISTESFDSIRQGLTVDTDISPSLCSSSVASGSHSHFSVSTALSLPEDSTRLTSSPCKESKLNRKRSFSSLKKNSRKKQPPAKRRMKSNKSNADSRNDDDDDEEDARREGFTVDSEGEETTSIARRTTGFKKPRTVI